MSEANLHVHKDEEIRLGFFFMNSYIGILKVQFSETLRENENLRKTLVCTAEKLGFSIDKFLEGLLYYDGRCGSFGNEVYADYGVRGALYLKYFIKETYHIERQKIISGYVQKCLKKGAKNFVDIGYGAPGLYIENNLINQEDVSITLLDKFESAQKFAKALLDCLIGEKVIGQKIKFAEYDFDTMVSPGFFDTYLMFDSIEHAKNPTGSMRLIVENAPRHAQFILSIPIVEKDKFGGSDEEDIHHIEWLTESDAIAWLTSVGLRVNESSIISPNKEVDQWCRGIDFYNFIVLCSKQS